MKLIALFFARLSVLLTKWAAIGVIWLASVFLVTSSALLMDQFSDWAKMLGSYTTPYAKQKAKAKAAGKRAATANKKVKAANKRVADASHRASKAEGRVKEQKRLAKTHSAKVKKIGGKMVARNADDATTSMIPVIGGAASVGFAVWDVYAACELITAQKQFELLMGTATAEEYTLLEASCVSTTTAVEATGKEAKRFIAATEQAIEARPASLPDLPDLPDLTNVTDGLADAMCRVTHKC
jgi:uncharacterized Zn-binding protein involved in type VI secretion